MTKTKEVIEHRLDADLPDEKLVEDLATIIGQAHEKLQTQPAVTLRFIVHNSGKNERTVDYDLTPQSLKETEKDVVFPAVVREILEKEFPPTVARNQRLIEHVTHQLRNDVYWSQEIVNLIKAIRRQQGLT